jgi:hypothetical protein
MPKQKGWKDKLHNVYDNDFEQFESYCRCFAISERLGFKTPKDAWETNPTIAGSTYPEDLRVVKTRIK